MVACRDAGNGGTLAGERVASRPPVHAVSVAGKELFLVSIGFAGVLHYRHGAWKKEAVEIPPGSRISVAGDKAIVVIAAVSEGDASQEGPIAIRSCQRRPDGRWSGPQELAREDSPLFWDRPKRPGLVVQAYAPPKFVPVAWSCKDADERKRVIKFLRVPVTGT